MILEYFEILTQNEIFFAANEKKIIKRLSVVTTFKRNRRYKSNSEQPLKA